MPTIARLGRVYIRMFASDHGPPHFHIWTPDGEALMLISGLQIQRGRVRSSDLDLVMSWAKEHIDLLESEWTRLNG